MARTFDITELDPTKYDWNYIMDIVRAQTLCEEFMGVFREDLEDLRRKSDLLTAFITFIDREALYNNAASEVPELRQFQDYDTSADTVINTILRSCKHQRKTRLLRPHQFYKMEAEEGMRPACSWCRYMADSWKPREQELNL